MTGVMIERRYSTIVALNGRRASALANFDVEAILRRLSSRLQVEVIAFDHDVVMPNDVRSIARLTRDKIKNNEFNRAFLLGAELEHHVTVVALQFMAEGIDTFLLRDLTFSADQKFDTVHEMRLFSIGVVPTTLGQLLMEWLAFESEEAERAKLLEVMKVYRTIVGSAPRT